MRKKTLLLTAVLALCGALAAAGAGEKPVMPKVDEKTRKRRVTNRRLYNKVYQSSLLQEPKQARQAFRKAQDRMEKQNPSDVGDASVGQALFQRGYLAMEAKEYKSAIVLFQEMAKRFPWHAYADDALYQVGYIYQHRLRDYPKAAAAYSQLVKLYKDRETVGQALFNNAYIGAQSGKIDKAMKQWTQARDVSRAQRFGRGNLDAQNTVEQQSDLQIKWMVANSADTNQEPMTLYFKGNQKLQEGKVKDATRNFKLIQTKYAKSLLADDAAFALAECERRALKLNEAAKLYAEFVKKYPKSAHAPVAKFRLAEIKRVAGAHDDARKLYEAARADIARLVAEGLKKKPPIKREDISPQIRDVLDLSSKRIREMSRVSPAAH